MQPRLFRWSAEKVMKSFVMIGLPLARRSTRDQVMHTLRGDHGVQGSSRKSGITLHACFSSSMVGILVADIVRALGAQYNTSLAASSYPGDSKCNVVWRRGPIEGKYTNAGLKTAYWIRTIPHCHEGTKDEFSCPFCRAMATGWGVHMRSACIILPLLCLWSFANIANRLPTQEYSIQWQSPAAFSTTNADAFGWFATVTTVHGRQVV